MYTLDSAYPTLGSRLDNGLSASVRLYVHNGPMYPLGFKVQYQGAYKFGKTEFPEFSRFSRPCKQLFPDNYKEKTRCNDLNGNQFSSFLAEVQNILFKEHGDWLTVTVPRSQSMLLLLTIMHKT